MIYLLENSRGLGCSRLLWQEHFLEAGASRGPLQGVFLSHIPDVLLQPPQGDRCLQTHIKHYGGRFFFFDISQQTAALNDTLVQFTIMSRPTQTMASISFASQANISPEAPGRHPKQTPPFFIIPLGFGDLGALFHYTATIISQRKLKSFNLWKALLPKSAAASYSWWCLRNGLNLAIVHAGHPLAIDDPQFSP